MDIKVDKRKVEEGLGIVDILGEIDVYTSSWVKEAIAEFIKEGNYNIIINLEGVRYIDSTGLGVLIGALKRVKEHEGSISLICTNPQIKKIFNITGLSKIFAIYKSEEEALAAHKEG
ncbi:MAG: STAS domain-containing protein [Chloroflexi bacterium]|nr:STAS domain-containing protein [Chloroflexota bacterium]